MKQNTASKNVLINNVVPLNNGDYALFISLYRQFLNKGYSVQIATYNFDLAKQLYPDLPFVPELGQHKLFVKLPFLKKWLAPFLFSRSKAYKKADFIIGAPGGYINSYYSIKNSLSIYQTAAKKGKKVGIYAQSVGPLNESDKAYFSQLMGNAVSFILVRDTFSEAFMKKLKIPTDRYKKTKDAAFLLESTKKVEQVSSKKIAVSVREWLSDGRSIDKHIALITKLVQLSIEAGYKVDFLSTCQGIPSYKDDSILARKIANQLPSDLQSKVNVLSDFFAFDAFYKKMEDYELVIGTRLHMCITALTHFIPTFNISYEIKGKECYNYLSLEEYSIDYNEDIQTGAEKFTAFLNNKTEIKEHLTEIISKVNKEVQDDFEFFLKKIT